MEPVDGDFQKFLLPWPGHLLPDQPKLSYPRSRLRWHASCHLYRRLPTIRPNPAKKVYWRQLMANKRLWETFDNVVVLEEQKRVERSQD